MLSANNKTTMKNTFKKDELVKGFHLEAGTISGRVIDIEKSMSTRKETFYNIEDAYDNSYIISMYDLEPLDIDKCNQLIAELMELKISEKNPKKCYHPHYNDGSIGQMAFQNSWNWTIPAIEKTTRFIGRSPKRKHIIEGVLNNDISKVYLIILEVAESCVPKMRESQLKFNASKSQA